MKLNEGIADRGIRVVLALVLGFLAYQYLGLMGGSIGGIIAAVVAVVLLVTGLVGFCPAYKLVGLSTCPLKKS